MPDDAPTDEPLPKYPVPTDYPTGRDYAIALEAWYTAVVRLELGDNPCGG